MRLEKAHTVSAIAAVDLANELIERDILCLQGLATISDTLAGLYRDHQNGISIIENRVTEADFILLWRAAEAQGNNPSLGIEIGKLVNVNAKGVLANWLSCCETLKESFSVFQQNIRLLNASECWTVDYDAEYVTFTFKFASTLRYPTMAIERSMVAFVAWSEFFSGVKLNIASASFTFAKPGHSDLYEPIFGASINFNSAANCIKLTALQLDVPINGANLYLRDLIAERSVGLDLSMPSSPSIKAEVKNLLGADLKKYSSIDATLGILHMSRTTLYRKLKEEQAIFSELVFKARINRLAKIDQATGDAQEIAEALGFNDVSSYYKFLKRIES